MAKHIKNMNDLQKAFMPVMTKMVDKLAENVYETLNYYLLDYYTGWKPDRRIPTFGCKNKRISGRK